MDNGLTYKQQRYKDIINEQVLISYLSKGALNMVDTEFVTPFDRELILQSIIDIREQEVKAQEEAMKN